VLTKLDGSAKAVSVLVTVILINLLEGMDS
jgi:hypothetical protein